MFLSQLSSKSPAHFTASMAMTPPDLDPFDLLAWDMNPDGYREPHQHDAYYLTLEVLNEQYQKIHDVIMAAVSNGFQPTYSLNDLKIPYDLLAAPGGYTKVMRDMLAMERTNVHGRRWNPFARTWYERFQPPKN